MRRFGTTGLLLVVALGAFSFGAAALAAGLGGAPRVANLTGVAEVPGPGDPDGTGFATIRLNVGQERVCWDLSVSGIDGTVVAAHIHVGPAGVAGPVVVPLSPPTSGSSSGCSTGVNPALVQDIIDNPGSYYVNVHSSVFPAGAVRGQLAPRPE